MRRSLPPPNSPGAPPGQRTIGGALARPTPSTPPTLPARFLPQSLPIYPASHMHDVDGAPSAWQEAIGAAGAASPLVRLARSADAAPEELDELGVAAFFVLSAAASSASSFAAAALSSLLFASA